MAGRGNRLEVADLDSDSVTRFDSGVRFTQVMSGWSFDHDVPVVIVASQHGRADQGAHHQADVFSLEGERLAQVRSDDLETLWRPYHSNGAVLALSRSGSVRTGPPTPPQSVRRTCPMSGWTLKARSRACRRII
jgi:hypothetical protein